MAEEKKDDGLVFDELGVDQIFIDEVTTSRTSTRRPRWTASPASKPAAANAPSTST